MPRLQKKRKKANTLVFIHSCMSFNLDCISQTREEPFQSRAWFWLRKEEEENHPIQCYLCERKEG